MDGSDLAYAETTMRCNGNHVAIVFMLQLENSILVVSDVQGVIRSMLSRVKSLCEYNRDTPHLIERVTRLVC